MKVKDAAVPRCTLLRVEGVAKESQRDSLWDC